VHSSNSEKNDDRESAWCVCKLSRYRKMPTRIATLPIAVMKDVVNGGLVDAGKNIVLRLKKVVKDDTTFNHAQIDNKKRLRAICLNNYKNLHVCKN